MRSNNAILGINKQHHTRGVIHQHHLCGEADKWRRKIVHFERSHKYIFSILELIEQVFKLQRRGWLRLPHHSCNRCNSCHIPNSKIPKEKACNPLTFVQEWALLISSVHPGSLSICCYFIQLKPLDFCAYFR